MKGLTFAMGALTAISTPTFPPDEDTALHTLADELLIEINRARFESGLDLLFKYEPAICAASMQNNYMVLEKTCGHDPGTNPLEKLYQCGGDWGGAGEIIACGYPDAKTTVDACINSPPHAKIILSPNYNVFGASAFGGNYVVTFGAFEAYD
jgi:uncharacterized protein YkwD